MTPFEFGKRAADLLNLQPAKPPAPKTVQLDGGKYHLGADGKPDMKTFRSNTDLGRLGPRNMAAEQAVNQTFDSRRP